MGAAMKCARPKCDNKAAHGGRLKGLCEKHYASIPTGYVDGDPVRRRLLRLNRSGYSYRQIAELSGRSQSGLHMIRHSGRNVQIDTAIAIMAISVPAPFTGCGIVDATGIHRRINALRAIGWTQRAMELRLGMTRGYLSTVLQRPTIYAETARKIADLYDELSATPGPCGRTRKIAQRKGWPPPLTWDDIDDPDERPDSGIERPASFMERYEEYRDHIGLTDRQIAERMGIQLNSLQVAISRERRRKA